MSAALSHLAGSLLAEAAWGDVVRSLEGAIEGRDHALILAWVLGMAVVVWGNWKLARYLLSRPRSRS